jgi:hypothetical protein
MDKSKGVVWIMILFGFVRAALIYVGTRLESHGIIEHETFVQLIGEGATQIVGYLVIGLSLAWTVLQKKQVFGWLKTAPKMDKSSTPRDVIEAAPGPDKPL